MFISSSVRDSRGSRLVYEMAVAKAFDGEGRIDRMGLITCDSVSKHVSRAGRSLESASSPAAILVQALIRCLRDDGGPIRGHINDTAPVTLFVFLVVFGFFFFVCFLCVFFVVLFFVLCVF